MGTKVDNAFSFDDLQATEGQDGEFSFDDLQAQPETGGVERGPAPPAPGVGSPTLPAPGAPQNVFGTYPYANMPAQNGYWPAGTERTPFEAPVVTGNRDVDVAIEPLTGLNHRIQNTYYGAKDKLFLPGMRDIFERGDAFGLAGAVPGLAGMVFSPVGGALEPLSRPINEYASPIFEKVFGTPPEITTPVLTSLIPGMGITKAPGLPKAPTAPYVPPKTAKPGTQAKAAPVEPSPAAGDVVPPEPAAPKYSAATNAGQVTALTKKIDRAQTELDALAALPDSPDIAKVRTALEASVGRWRQELDALATPVAKQAPPAPPRTLSNIDMQRIKSLDKKLAQARDELAILASRETTPDRTSHVARLNADIAKWVAKREELSGETLAPPSAVEPTAVPPAKIAPVTTKKISQIVDFVKQKLAAFSKPAQKTDEYAFVENEALRKYFSNEQKYTPEEQAYLATIGKQLIKIQDDVGNKNLDFNDALESARLNYKSKARGQTDAEIDALTALLAGDEPKVAAIPKSPRAKTKPAVPAAGSPPPVGQAQQPTGGGLPPRPPTNSAGAPPPPGLPPIPPATPPVHPSILDLAKRAADNIEKIFSPTTVDKNSKFAEAVHRQEYGQGARDVAQAEAMFHEYQQAVNALPDQQRYEFIDYVETRANAQGRAPVAKIDPSLQPVADVLRTVMQSVRDKLEALPALEKARFIEEYFPHQWDNPQAATRLFSDEQKGSGGKEGSSGFLKGRSIPTVLDGLRAGLRLKNSNPIDATMAYVDNAAKFIAQGRVFQAARDAGLAKSYAPGKQPEGWMELTGRYSGKLTQRGQTRYYAPEGFARIYNNAISSLVKGPEGELLMGLQRTANFATAVELGISFFHAATMTQEAMVSGVASAISELRTGHPIRAAKKLIETPGMPVSYALTGGKMQRIYAGTNYKNKGYQKFIDSVTPDAAALRKTTDLLTKAGGRAIKMDKEYLGARQGSYVDAWRKGSLKFELWADAQEAKGQPISGTTRVALRHVARVLDTISGPMFQEWIPRLKLGAFNDHMGGWLRRNPNATEVEQVAAAREIWDSVDNRFGEMVRDNIFWKNSHKQAAQVALRSYTWTFGAGREIAGGIWDAGKQVYKAADVAGRKLEGKPITKEMLPRVTQRMEYVVALPIIYSLWNGVMTYLNTGEEPTGQDWVAGRTGGVLDDGETPERIIAPGFMKDVFGWTEKGVPGELYNKTATVPRLLMDMYLNKDWRGLPIAPGNHVEDPEAPHWLVAYMNHAIDSAGPFSLKNALRGQPEGSAITPLASFLGFQAAGKKFTDPEGYESMKRHLQTKEWEKKIQADERQADKYKGPQ